VARTPASPTMPIAVPAASLAVDVKVILMSPCIFCMENRE
jgi:hypothetical protein